jgi:putative membrane protein insertion efficiency factor
MRDPDASIFAGGSHAAAALPRRALWLLGWPVRNLLIGLTWCYRVLLGGVLGGQCRFHPTCSHYAMEAIRARGAVVGGSLAAWRILRCSPLSRGGIDPPPAPWSGRPRVGPRTAGSVVYDNVIPATREAAS